MTRILVLTNIMMYSLFSSTKDEEDVADGKSTMASFPEKKEKK